MLRILLISLTLSLSACSTVKQVRLYSGPQLSPEKEVQIILPEHFDAIEFNGFDIPQAQLKFRTGNMPLILPPGEHTITLQYHDIWNIDDENHETLTSGPIIFKLTALAGDVFRLEHTQLNTFEQAKDFSISPKVKLASDNVSVNGSHLKKANPLVFNQKETKPVRYPNLEQLKFWWDQATQYEREEFNLWLKKSN